MTNERKRKQHGAACRCRTWKLGIFLLGVVLLFPGWQFHSAASSYGWYCVHVPAHEQPNAGELSFVEELDAYYIDHRHSAVDDAERVIYLTFDAGYGNENVGKILDVLQEEQVTACFFILDGIIRHAPELVLRMANEGHTVGNHTMHHKDMSEAGDEALLAELTGLENAYRSLTGCELSKYYRPPQGRFSRANLECTSRNGYQTIFWSFAYPDWDNDRQPDLQKARKTILDNLHNGEVMLLHPTSATNAAILQDVICEIRAQGYRFGSMDELTGGATEAGE